jgi:hypothetical protein
MNIAGDISLRHSNHLNSHFFMTLSFRLRVVRTNDMFDREMKAQAKSAQLNLNASLSRMPLTALIRKRIFQLALLFIAVKEVYSLFISCSSIDTIGVSRFHSLKIGTTVPSNDMRLLRNGCLIFSAHDTHTISFPDSIEIDGFQISLSGNKSSNEITLEGSTNAGDDKWFTVGASDFRWTKNRLRFLSPSLKHSDTAGTLALDYRPPLAWFAENIIRSCLLALGCICSALSGVLCFPTIGRYFFFATCVCILLTDAAIATLYFCAGLNREAFNFVICAIAFSIVSWSLGRHEFFFSEACIVFGGLTLSGRIIRDCALFKDCTYLIDDFPLLEVLVLISGMLCAFSRQQFVRNAVLVIDSDREAFQAAWAGFEEGVAVEGMSEIINDVYKAGGSEARQYNRQRLTPDVGSSRICGGSWSIVPSDAQEEDPVLDPANTLPASADLANPITSLDQLYTQALGVVPVLHTKCTAWATESGGAFHIADSDRVSSSASGLTCESNGLPHDLQGWIRRGSIKQPERAMKKALLCYGGDVSRLMDVCRGRLVFGNAMALRGCLQAIMRDSGVVRVVRVKNFLQSQYQDNFRCAITGFKVRHFKPHEFNSMRSPKICNSFVIHVIRLLKTFTKKWYF